MKKRTIIPVICGLALLIAAFSLYAYNKNEDEQAGITAEHILESVKEKIPEGETGTDNSAGPDTSGPASGDTGIPVAGIEGYDYAGYIEIPALDLALPVMAEWDYKRLRIAPCIQFGSPDTDDLVIAAHNYKTHFGRLKELAEGDEVRFTDMEGNVNEYSVAKTDTLKPDETQRVQKSGYALVLYTCTYGGATRVCVFCQRVRGMPQGTQDTRN